MPVWSTNHPMSHYCVGDKGTDKQGNADRSTQRDREREKVRESDREREREGERERKWESQRERERWMRGFNQSQVMDAKSWIGVVEWKKKGGTELDEKIRGIMKIYKTSWYHQISCRLVSMISYDLTYNRIWCDKIWCNMISYNVMR